MGSNPASPTPRFESEGPSAFRFGATGSVYSRRLRRRVAFSPIAAGRKQACAVSFGSPARAMVPQRCALSHQIPPVGFADVLRSRHSFSVRTECARRTCGCEKVRTGEFRSRADSGRLGEDCLSPEWTFSQPPTRTFTANHSHFHGHPFALSQPPTRIFTATHSHFHSHPLALSQPTTRIFTATHSHFHSHPLALSQPPTRIFTANHSLISQPTTIAHLSANHPSI